MIAQQLARCRVTPSLMYLLSIVFQAFKERFDHENAIGTGGGTVRIPESYPHVGRPGSCDNLAARHCYKTRRLEVRPERGHADLQGSVYTRQTHNTIHSQFPEEY